VDAVTADELRDAEALHQGASQIKTRDIAPGQTYYAVYTATGVCIGRYLDETKAANKVAKDPTGRTLKEHRKP
jgi:hypothetical protein